MKRRSFLKSLLAVIALPGAVAEAVIKIASSTKPVRSMLPMIDVRITSTEINAEPRTLHTKWLVEVLNEGSEEIFRNTRRAPGNWIQMNGIRYYTDGREVKL